MCADTAPIGSSTSATQSSKSQATIPNPSGAWRSYRHELGLRAYKRQGNVELWKGFVVQVDQQIVSTHDGFVFFSRGRYIDTFATLRGAKQVADLI